MVKEKSVRRRPNARQRRRNQENAYAQVYEQYLETKEVSGTFSCESFYKRLAGTMGGSISMYVPGVVTVTPQDFLADVELVAAKFLPSNDLAAFKDGSFKASPEQVIQMGREFHMRRIFPLAKYFRPKDVR